ncbi:MAG: sulfite exporter TauE/SafE family protein, partial [Candidatus Aminicenantes bacterium]|nr:sulfite exporter TauE/SafE family protein [Candidatus Aminicenantes bacterium]
MESWQLALVVIALAYVCEYIDSSLGMGYGTTLTPLLMIAGFKPLQIVPSILLSEFITGLLAGFFHHRHKNVNFKKGTLDF